MQWSASSQNLSNNRQTMTAAGRPVSDATNYPEADDLRGMWWCGRPLHGGAGAWEVGTYARCCQRVFVNVTEEYAVCGRCEHPEHLREHQRGRQRGHVQQLGTEGVCWWPINGAVGFDDRIIGNCKAGAAGSHFQARLPQIYVRVREREIYRERSQDQWATQLLFPTVESS